MGKLLRRIHHRLNRNRLEHELDDEMSTHREMMPPERRAAFGNTQRLHDESRDLWGWLWLEFYEELAAAATPIIVCRTARERNSRPQYLFRTCRDR